MTIAPLYIMLIAIGVVGLIACVTATMIIGFWIWQQNHESPLNFSTSDFIIGLAAAGMAGACLLLVVNHMTRREAVPFYHPSKQEIIGTYQFDSDSLVILEIKSSSDVNSSLTFYDDYTFDMLNTPDVALNGGFSEHGLVSASGTWNIAYSDYCDCWVIATHFEWQRDEFRRDFYLAGLRPPYSIWLYTNYPDEKSTIWYIKQP